MVIFHCFVNVYQRVVSAIFGEAERIYQYVNADEGNGAGCCDTTRDLVVTNVPTEYGGKRQRCAAELEN